MQNYIFPENFEYKIGFDKIRQYITAHCLSSLGAEKVSEMTFSTEYEYINKQLHQVREFMRILREEDDFPTDGFYDVREALKKIRIEGTHLVEKELFYMRRSLETIQSVIRFFKQKQEKNDYPHLIELAEGISSFPQLTKQIDAILDQFGKIKDKASPELYRIRQQLTQTVNSISKTLQNILRTIQAEGLIEKDVSPTIRDGRLVIPVLPAYKRKIKGIVHDESASGKTVYIEPAEVVDANNRIRELEAEEKREILNILTSLTNIIRPEIPEIVHSYQFLAEIDFIRAKTLFSFDIGAIFPDFENKQQINWINAVHPLLYLSYRKQNKSVVPLDIELGCSKDMPENENTGASNNSGNVRILIISGPNAGGKSVLLKTVGLLQYMLQCGIPVPVGERSRAGIFKHIFLDIGDEQSIENDLSTYSSHLTNMKFMLKNSGAESLILIDEFGSGTEPQIGGAIAEAMLQCFNEKQCFGIITTHYRNLKTFAENHDGVMNGAMLYDHHLMQPLFLLSVGNPGSSFAVEIARKIGLPEDIIKLATEKVGQDYVDMDKYLQDIIRDKRYWETKRRQILQKEKRLEELTKRYQTDWEKIESQRKEIITKAQTDAERLLSKASAQIENTIREIKNAQAEKEKTKKIRKELEEFKQSLTEKPSHFTGSKLPVPVKKQQINTQLPNTGFSIGDFVRIKGQRSIGEIIEKKEKKFIVAFGVIKTTLKAEQIETVSRNMVRRERAVDSVITANSSDSLSEKKMRFKPEIDIRGMRGDEALQAVTYYIDDAIQCNAGRVRILHGTGSGILRQIVRDYLKTVIGIRNFQDEHVQFGGTGITVIELE
ncbi:MAG: endonuclease MutS2 [Dysgonamonadaceae bacterium]|jgi:DNA mismatch repair protein MutS2|nr:endonuclease MutS2 [Dysgonamonadaceae bacterium]